RSETAETALEIRDLTLLVAIDHALDGFDGIVLGVVTALRAERFPALLELGQRVAHEAGDGAVVHVRREVHRAVEISRAELVAETEHELHRLRADAAKREEAVDDDPE